MERISNLNCWDTEEKKIVVDTLNRYNTMRRKVITIKNELRDNKEKNITINNGYDWRFKK